MTHFSPREIVSELDRYIIGQKDAKRAVAIALRNRWRRQQLEPDLKEEVLPKNILMIGPTGVGKTEISRRLARLAGAPFIKIEATKFTEVGYVGRDVESIVRDLVEVGISLVRDRRREAVRARAEAAAEERVLDALRPAGRELGQEPVRAGQALGLARRDVALRAGAADVHEAVLAVRHHLVEVGQLLLATGVVEELGRRAVLVEQEALESVEGLALVELGAEALIGAQRLVLLAESGVDACLGVENVLVPLLVQSRDYLPGIFDPSSRRTDHSRGLVRGPAADQLVHRCFDIDPGFHPSVDQIPLEYAVTRKQLPRRFGNSQDSLLIAARDQRYEDRHQV